MEAWEKAAIVLKRGGVIIIPSDSCYGIAVLASNHKAVNRLYQIKNREKGKPSLIIVGSLDQAKELVEFTDLAASLANKFWPGGLTMVLSAKIKDLADAIYGDGKTLAIRLPAKSELRWLAGVAGPFILPSANFAGQPPPYYLDDLNQTLAGKVDLVVSEPTDGGEVSTLVDVRGTKPVILRPGSIELTER